MFRGQGEYAGTLRFVYNHMETFLRPAEDAEVEPGKKSTLRCALGKRGQADQNGSVSGKLGLSGVDTVSDLEQAVLHESPRLVARTKSRVD